MTQSDKTSTNSAQEKRNKRIALSIAAVFFLQQLWPIL
jgi:hypothetical protein